MLFPFRENKLPVASQWSSDPDTRVIIGNHLWRVRPLLQGANYQHGWCSDKAKPSSSVICSKFIVTISYHTFQEEE